MAEEQAELLTGAATGDINEGQIQALPDRIWELRAGLLGANLLAALYSSA